ncbi:hypothetical protein D3C75_1023300 [compost metagenome]
MHGRAEQQATGQALALRPADQQVAVFVLHHPGDFRDNRAGRYLYTSADVIALEEHVGQFMSFFSCSLQHVFQQVFIRYHQMLEALEGGWIGDVEQIQRCVLLLAQQCGPLCCVAGSAGQVGGNQYVVQRGHIGFLMQCCAHES